MSDDLEVTSGMLRHYASEPRQYRLIESVLLAAADKMERLERELAECRKDLGHK